MNPIKTNHHLQTPQEVDSQPHQYQYPFPFAPIIFRDDDEEDALDSPSHSSSDESSHPTSLYFPITNTATQPPVYINPEPHISTQFYTFNRQSHTLMAQCILQNRLATPDEIRLASPRPVLKSWRSVWKDRNEDTAYLTAWKRIQDKLNAQIDAFGNQVLYFKNNPQQLVSHFDQWQEIVTRFHYEVEHKHLGLKETVERIKQVWTVGAKFYGIPESFIRVCVTSCNVCSNGSLVSRGKRRRFEYTEAFEVPAKEAQVRLQQLAAKHKVVLCIRQKYIRYKPFMAEVKDYACHRAGDPNAKKSKGLKREPYMSKRCGCGFRIRAIVPIANYNEKDKSFVYQDEGVAMFKLYAVHSGHEPGPLDGNARIMHRAMGHKGGGLLTDPDTVYGDVEGCGLMGTEDGDLQLRVFNQVQELKVELGLLGEKIMKMPHEILSPLPQQLFDMVNWVRNIGEDGPSRPIEPLSGKDDVLVGENELTHWGADTELIEEDEDGFEPTLDGAMPWDQMSTECRSRKNLMVPDNCKSDKWLKDACIQFDEKSIMECEEDSKLIKPLRLDETVITDAGLVGIHVDNFYPDNSKWYDSTCGLDPGSDCGDSEFRPGEIV
ncbi:hypothetical protein GIB67_021336 [Kingdonia uniflora]|uniref:Uncharacterized protein n=1 Tax=Kingdonia uniflora TaxID=39325 RepID=A0A7J7KZB2_9MAGN|nr:hypothetical protein GIB67_021336 [Kingdonia uniflora]